MNIFFFFKGIFLKHSCLMDGKNVYVVCTYENICRTLHVGKPGEFFSPRLLVSNHSSKLVDISFFFFKQCLLFVVVVAVFLNLFLYLFLAVLGLRFCARALSSCGKWGPLFTVVCKPLTIAVSPIAEHRLQTHRLSSCGPQAQPLRGMRDPPRPGLEPMSPAPAGRLSTTAPPAKPS